MKKTFLASILSILFFFSLGAVFLFAQVTQDNNGVVGQDNQTKGTTNNIHVSIINPFRVGDNLYDLAKAIVDNIVLPIGGVLCVLAFIYSGFLYVTAGGNQTKIDQAHKALLYSAVGTALLLGAWLFANVIRGTVNQLIT